ncbi:hypothetical protein CPB84DRAFT_1849934 [Gymnopilus junonius]|uniref:Uncharacterized protein n=1 Tax=Gymnopilus junonius TaxID=109634 RepID=A0A9P5NHR2_GYMJU|nr:hypothetical protein CPB84DRAFT_1849934 [Gymnopilus junonius]
MPSNLRKNPRKNSTFSKRNFKLKSQHLPPTTSSGLEARAAPVLSLAHTLANHATGRLSISDCHTIRWLVHKDIVAHSLGNVNPPGCGFVSFGSDGSPTYLPLKSVSARVYIIDTFARVVLTQLYTNNVDKSSAAQYVFPVPASGAVCAFKMQTSDGQVVNGVVKERSKAKNEYDVAIMNNKWAGLMYEATPDVFVISMGAIGPEQDVEVTIVYVVELSDGDLPGYDQAEFRLQTYIADRYGRSPKEMTSSSSSSATTTFDVMAEIQMTSDILSISSRSHPIIVDKRNWKNAGTLMHTAKVKLSPSFSPRLDRDFVLAIQSSKLGQPRCVAERRPSEMTIAMSLSFVPRFELNQLPTQEYIFLLDRSGSMAGSRINHAKDALLILLKSLPNEGTLFNIFSFGSSSSPLWYSSQKYTPSTLDIALQHVNSMWADMGGTEIENCLRSALMSRNRTIPASIFLLTDGEVWGHDSIFRLVDAEVMNAENAANGTQLRIFTLGVGDAASTALCKGIARRGNGLCLMTAHSVDISQKCARLLAASTVPSLGSLGDIFVDWGYIPVGSSPGGDKNQQSPNKSQIVFNDEYDPLARIYRKQPILPDPPNVQQAPTDVPDLYPSNRFTVYVILSDTNEIPKTVTLYGTLPNGSVLSLPPVDVHEALDMEVGFPPLIHTLAANRLITELEDGNTASQGAFDDNVEELREAVIEAAVVRLSETYQLASQFASFIAVDEATKDFRDDEPDGTSNSSDSDQDDDQLDGLADEPADDVEMAGVYSGDDEDDSDILDGKDDDEFYSARSSVGSVRSLSMGSLYSQTPKSSSAQPEPNDIPIDRTFQSQGLTMAFNHGGSSKFSQPNDVVSVQGQDTVDVPAEYLQVLSTDVPAIGTEQVLKLVEASYPTHQIVFEESAPEVHLGGPTSFSAAGSFSEPAIPPTFTVEKVHQPTEFVEPQPSHETPVRLSHEVEDFFSSPISISLAQVTQARTYEAVEMVNETDSNLRDVIKPALTIESLPKLRMSLPSSTEVVGYGESPIMLSLAERNFTEPESPEDDLYGLSEPPSAGSLAFESIDSVLSKLSMREQATVELYQHSDDEASEGSVSPSTEASELAYEGMVEEHPIVIWIPASATSHTERKPVAIATPTTTTTAHDNIVAAARLQRYDGSFDLNDQLCSLMGKKLSTAKLRRTIPSYIRGHQDSEKIWATILAAAYMKTCLADNRDVWIGLWQKATNYIKATLGADISLTYLVDEASKLL